MAGAPIGLSALEGFELAVAEMRNRKLGVLSTTKIAAWSTLNNLSNGFGAGDLVQQVTAFDTTGQSQQVYVNARVPAGAWFKTTVVGGTLVAFDILISWASRKLAKVNSGVRFMGTKLTGGK